MEFKPKKYPGAFPGTIKAPLDVSSLTKSSDLVCVGEVEDVQTEGEVKFLIGNEVVMFTRKVARFRVDRVEKGTPPGRNIEIEFLHTDFPSSLERLQSGESLKLFLKKNHRWRFAHPTTSKCEPDFTS